MLTDTTFWIDLAAERAAGRVGPAHHFMATHRSGSFAMSIVTWDELAVGFERSQPLERLLARVRVVPLPRQVAWEASRIKRELMAMGEQLGENDNWIAATARAWGFRLISRDRAFERVPRLHVLRY